MGSKWSRKFFSFLKLNYKQKPFERTLLELLGTKYGCSAPFWSETSFSKNWKKSISEGFSSENSLKKNLQKSIFFNFLKNLFHFKKAQSSHILSPEALIECVRKVFAYSLILKRKKIFATILNPSNPPLFKAQKHVFSRNPILAPYQKIHFFSASMAKTIFFRLSNKTSK